MQVEQADNHQPKHDAAPSSTATGCTGHGEIGCKVREEADEQRYAEERDAAVLLSNSSAWPNADGVSTDSSQDTQDQRNKTAQVGSRVSHHQGIA